MNTNKVQYKTINEPHEWFSLITNDQYIVHNVDFSNQKVLQVYYSYNNEIYEVGNQVSVSLASFVTCHARLKLLSEIEKIGKRVLYFDTDSIIYISRNNEYDPAIGDYLGEFTNELPNNNYIKEFVSAGPKNYAYELDNKKSSCTVKGFTLNSIASLKINFDSIKAIVKDSEKPKIETLQQKFSRNKRTWENSTSEVTKKYGFVYDKRVLCKDYETLPFGF